MIPAPAPAEIDRAPASAVASRARSAPPPPPRQIADMAFLRKLLWLNLALWVGEGALRKWFLPGLASPLLIVRDPVVVLTYALAWQKGIFPRTGFIFWIAGIALTALFISIIGTQAPLFVELYGLRSDFMHLPLIFLMPVIFNRDDVRLVGKWTLISAVPMALLVLLQFGAGPNSRLNAGAGGETGGMIESAFGHIRPSGTFSFTNGLSDYTAAVAAFFMYQLLEKNKYPRLLWLAAIPSLLIMVVLSGSRGAVGIVLVVLCTVVFISFLQIRYLKAAVRLAAVAGVMFLVLGSFAIFKGGMEVLMYRFGSAENVKSGFVDRFFDGLVSPLQVISSVKAYGVGLGMGTSVASGMMFHGQRGFLYAVNEMQRVLYESGPFMGSVFLALRLAILLALFWRAFVSMRREAYTLPMLLVGAFATEMLTGKFGQATTLGYVTLVAGLCLAANQPGEEELVALAAAGPRRRRGARTFSLGAPNASPAAPRPLGPTTLPGKLPESESDNGATPEAAIASISPALGQPRFRGRSVYAERLHGAAVESPLAPGPAGGLAWGDPTADSPSAANDAAADPSPSGESA